MTSDEQTVGPTDPKPQGANNIEYVLATRANDAMSKGADPHAVTNMLGQMITHLRANPQHAASASNALAQGADPAAVASTVYELSNSATGHSESPVTSTPETPAAGPGVLSRAGSKIAGGLKQVVTHPLDTAAGMVTAPVKSLFTATVAPGVGEARPDARLSKGGNSSGRAIDTTPYDAQHGGVTTGERTAAGVQSVVNAALPEAGKYVSKFAGPVLSKVPVVGKWLSKAAPLATTGAAEGAAYNPDDPAAGAISGAVVTPVVGGAIRAGTSAAGLGSTVRRVRSAPDLGEHVVEHNAETATADKQNYGAADAEGQANPSSSTVRDALEHPRIKPYADLYRESDAGKGASDAKVAAEALKLMSRDQRALEQKQEIKGEYDAAADLKARDLKNARRMLKTAVATPGTAPRAPTTREAIGDFQAQAGTSADRSMAIRDLHGKAPEAMARETTETPAQREARVALERHGGTDGRAPLPSVAPAPKIRTQETPAVMPSLPNAINEHARMMGNRAAFNTGADQTRRILTGTPIAAKRLDTQGGPAFLSQIKGMTPEEAQHATTGTLGRTNDLTKYQAPDHHTTMFGAAAGVIRPLVQINKMRPYLKALDQQSGKSSPHSLDLELAMRNLGLVNAGIAQKDSTP